MQFDFIFLIAAFAGGVFGAAVSGLFNFVLCGLATLVAVGVGLAGFGDYGAYLANGPLFLPAISFAGGAAAAAYAKSRGKLANGRDIGTPLISLNAPDVLIVGGLFGALGYVIKFVADLVPMIGDQTWTNTVAFTVMVNAIVVRLVFGKTGVFGKVRSGDNRWRASEVAAWLPWQTDPLQLLVVGLGFGTAVAWCAVKIPAAAGVWFGFSAFALILLQFGQNAPVWHHIVLATEQAVFMGGDLWWGITFGVVGAFLGDFMAQLFLSHGDSHIDPPACSLWVTFTLTAILRATGILAATNGMVSLVIMVVVSAGLYALAAAMKAKPNTAQVPAKA